MSSVVTGENEGVRKRQTGVNSLKTDASAQAFMSRRLHVETNKNSDCKRQLFSLLAIIFMKNRVTVYSVKCQKTAKNAHLNFAEPNVTSSNRFFCPNSPKHKDSFSLINDTEKQQILTFKTLNQKFFLIFYLKMIETMNQL